MQLRTICKKTASAIRDPWTTALDALERDHAFLLRRDVFSSDVIETWLDYKRKKEVDAIRLRPHPHEFHLYYDLVAIAHG
jgi:glutamine synthetase